MQSTIKILTCSFIFNICIGQNNTIQKNQTDTPQNKVNWQFVYYYQVRKNDSLEKVKHKMTRQKAIKDSLQHILIVKSDSVRSVLHLKRDSLQNICAQLNSRGSEYYYYVSEIYRRIDPEAKFVIKGSEFDIVDYQIARTSLFRNMLYNLDGFSSGRIYYREDIRIGAYFK